MSANASASVVPAPDHAAPSPERVAGMRPSVPAKPGLWAEIKKHKVSYLFLAPFLILFFLFIVIPILTA